MEATEMFGGNVLKIIHMKKKFIEQKMVKDVQNVI